MLNIYLWLGFVRLLSRFPSQMFFYPNCLHITAWASENQEQERHQAFDIKPMKKLEKYCKVHYIRKGIQNEIITLLEYIIIDKTLEKIKQLKYFFTVLNCTSDISKRTDNINIPQCFLKYTKDNIEMKEHFGLFLQLYDIIGEGLCDTVINIEITGMENWV